MGPGTILYYDAHMRAALLSSIMKGKCPACREGLIFQSYTKVHDRCSVCGIRFSREPGYFVGAMYIAYGLAGAIVAALTFVVHAIFSLTLYPALLTAAILFLPLVPFLVRLSRTLWIYFDRAVDPLD